MDEKERAPSSFPRSAWSGRPRSGRLDRDFPSTSFSNAPTSAPHEAHDPSQPRYFLRKASILSWASRAASALKPNSGVCSSQSFP
jgi:hypothetical protein